MNKFVFEVEGKPAGANVGGFGNRQIVKLPDGSVRMGKIKADPEIGLYTQIETGPQPDKYQVAGEVVHAKNGTVYTSTRSVQSKSIEDIKKALKKEVKQKRTHVRDAGIEWSNDDGVTTHVVQTDSASQGLIVGAVVGIDTGDLTEQAWRMRDNSVVVIPAEDFKALAMEVRDHVNASLLQQAVFEAQINAASDIETLIAIDIDTGWPDHYVAPEGPGEII